MAKAEKNMLMKPIQMKKYEDKCNDNILYTLHFFLVFVCLVFLGNTKRYKNRMIH